MYQCTIGNTNERDHSSAKNSQPSQVTAIYKNIEIYNVKLLLLGRYCGDPGKYLLYSTGLIAYCCRRPFRISFFLKNLEPEVSCHDGKNDIQFAMRITRLFLKSRNWKTNSYFSYSKPGSAEFHTSDSCHAVNSQEKVKTAVFMLNMGGPSTLEEVELFLTRLFTDKDIIPLPAQSQLGPAIAKRRSPKIVERYRQIGGGSPILKWTEKQGKLMTDILNKISPGTGPHKHFVGFRYANPLTEDTLDEMEKAGIERVVGFSQYPQYSCSTSGSSLNAIHKYYSKRSEPSKLKWSFIDRWPIHSAIVDVFAEQIKSEMAKFPEAVRNNVLVLFSAHALPMKAVNTGDSYPIEVAGTVLKVMEKLNFAYPYRLVWQSKVGPLPWLAPQTDDAMRGFVKKGHKNFLLVPITFVNEHIETLHELDIEYGKELAEEIGVEHIRRVPAPNDHPIFVKGLAEIVKSHLEANEICSNQLFLRCPMCVKPSCQATKDWIMSQKKYL